MNIQNQQIHPLDDPRLVRAFLDQGDAWCMGSGMNSGDNYLGSGRRTADGMLYVSINQMTPSHALNTARFILNKARDIYLCLLVASGGEATPPVIEGMDDDASCRRALRQTALVQALLARAAVRPESTLPWESVRSLIENQRLIIAARNPRELLDASRSRFGPIGAAGGPATYCQTCGKTRFVAWPHKNCRPEGDSSDARSDVDNIPQRNYGGPAQPVSSGYASDAETADGVEEGVVDRDQYARADPLGLGFDEADGMPF